MEQAMSRQRDAASELDKAGHPEDCVRLTEDQYTSLTELVTDPLFRRAVLRAAYPSWQKLMEGAGKVKGFVWIVHYLWLGALKFALLSKNVKDASNLYDEIYTIFERQAERFFDVLHSRLSFKPPFRMRLAFNHVSDGLFQLKLDLYAMSNTPQCEGAPVLSCQEAGRNVRMLSSKAMHIKRDSPWPRSAWFLPRHLSPNLIQQAIDKDGAVFDHEDLVPLTEGTTSMPFRHEVRCTTTYIAEQLEMRGERLDWEYLLLGITNIEDCRNTTLFTKINDDLGVYIEQSAQRLFHLDSAFSKSSS